MSEKKITEINWSFRIRPQNKIKISIMQRQDGPFNKDVEKGLGHYYIGAERWDGSTWNFIKNSTGQTSYDSFEEAYNAALTLEMALGGGK